MLATMPMKRPDIDALTIFKKPRRKYQVFRELLLHAQQHHGGLPNKSGCHRLVNVKHKMGWTTFCRHFQELEDEGLVVHKSDRNGVTTVYIPDAIWQAPEWIDL